jgi:hypothetical protein
MEDVAGMPPFRRAASELTEAAIRRALSSGDLVTQRRGVLVGRRRIELASDPRDVHALAIETAIAGTPGPPVYACLGSAALLHDIARLGRTPERVRLYRARGGPRRDEGVAVLVCGLPDDHVEIVSGLPSTTRARTAIDLARWVTFRSGVVVMDSTLHGGATRSQLDAVTSRCARWPGIRKARQAVDFADGRAESPLESISRVAFCEMGLPAPEVQVPLGPDDYPVGIVDFYWEEFGVVGEADGLMKYDGEDNRLSLRAEKLRQEALEALGFIVVRWNWEDIWRRPDWVAGRLRTAFREGARRRIA